MRKLNSETIDCIWNGFTMNGREDDYTWSDPYIDNKQVVVVRSDSGIDDFSGLKGKHVEVQTDSSALAGSGRRSERPGGNLRRS